MNIGRLRTIVDTELLTSDKFVPAIEERPAPGGVRDHDWLIIGNKSRDRMMNSPDDANIVTNTGDAGNRVTLKN